jgi:DNA processing protein
MVEVRRPRDLTAAEELRALLVLRLLPGVGDKRALQLLQAQGSARRALALSGPAFAAAVGPGAERARTDAAILARSDRILEACVSLGIRIVPYGAEEYPVRLQALVDPPPLLFLRGKRPVPEGRVVAIVGSRRATPVGRRTAERLARELSGTGVTVVSGLALGIDGAAHRGALAGEGGTVAVLGSGPDHPHPPGNSALFERILEQGLVVSEFPPGEPPRPYHFPRRNRVIAALSRAVVVVEAAEKSGALITVDHALDLGLDVFAVPGSVESPQAAGTNALIRDGAHLLTRGDELLEVMGWSVPRRALPHFSAAGSSSDDAPSRLGSPRGVSAVLGATPQSLESLVEAFGQSAATLLAELTRAELAGEALRSDGGWVSGRSSPPEVRR